MKTFIHEDTEIYEIKTKNNLVKVTPLHRFYIKRNNEYMWIPAKDITTSDFLINANKEKIEIYNITNKKENNTVYNFEVENNHNYFVSEENILVHNVKASCTCY